MAIPLEFELDRIVYRMAAGWQSGPRCRRTARACIVSDEELRNPQYDGCADVNLHGIVLDSLSIPAQGHHREPLTDSQQETIIKRRACRSDST